MASDTQRKYWRSSALLCSPFSSSRLVLCGKISKGGRTGGENETDQHRGRKLERKRPRDPAHCGDWQAALHRLRSRLLALFPALPSQSRATVQPGIGSASTPGRPSEGQIRSGCCLDSKPQRCLHVHLPAPTTFTAP